MESGLQGRYQLIRLMIRYLGYPILRRTRCLRDLHKGETCYLIADGISIKNFDFSAFSDHISILGGKIPIHRDATLLNAKYWVNPAPVFWCMPWTDTARTMRKLYSSRRARNIEVQPIVNLINMIFSRGTKSLYLFDDYLDSRLDETFISKRVNCFANTATMLISVAIYMGFSKAYLVGFDYTHIPPMSHHWYESGRGIADGNLEYNKEFFHVANEFIELVSITPGNQSSSLQHISYKQLTGKDPIFRDNRDLLSNSDFDLLSRLNKYYLMT